MICSAVLYFFFLALFLPSQGVLGTETFLPRGTDFVATAGFGSATALFGAGFVAAAGLDSGAAFAATLTAGFAGTCATGAACLAAATGVFADTT